MLKTRTLIAAALVLACAAPGCMKKPSYGDASEAPSMEVTSMDADGDYGGGYAEESEAMPMAPPEPSPAMDEGFKRSAPAPSRSPSSGAPGGLAPAGSSAPETTSGPVKDTGAAKSGDVAKPGDPAKASDEPEKVARQIIYVAEMHLSVFKLEEAMGRVEALALDVGGYVQQMRDGFYIIRVPAARLRDVMSGVGGLGMVTQRSLQARDVTEEFVDLTTRIRVLRETQLQLIDLLKKAKNVEEALHVRQALDQVTMELEQALGRLRMLENLIGFSTLTVYLEERGPQNQIPSSNDPFPWVDSLGVEATEWN